MGARGSSVFVASGDGGVAGGDSEPPQCMNEFVPAAPGTCPLYVLSGSLRHGLYQLTG